MMKHRILAIVYGLGVFSTGCVAINAEQSESQSRLATPQSTAVAPPPALESAANVERDIKETLDAMANIKYMRPGQHYDLKVGGELLQGPKEVFLRRRTADEILQSDLSSGCGDYAAAFTYLIERRGLKTLFIDSAQLSIASLITQFSGHAVVAVQDEKNGRWFLVDPTAKRILSDNWSPKEKIFADCYWIGFQGPLADYPVHGPEELRAFYQRVLKSVPQDVWSQHVVGLRLVVDQSLKTDDGEYVNPRIARLLAAISQPLEDYNIQPQRWVEISLVKGEPGPSSTMRFSDEDGWVCQVGSESALSTGFIAYMERAVSRRIHSAGGGEANESPSHNHSGRCRVR